MSKRFYLLFFLSLSSIWAQSFDASVRGLVTDPSNAAVPAAAVTLREVDQNTIHTAKTDSTGHYVITAVPPGRYMLTIEARGFSKAERSAFTLEVEQMVTIDMQLEVGTATSVVEVSGGSSPLINTTEATLGQVVENEFINSMPLSSRNPLTLVSMAAGVTGSTGGVNFVANGVRNSTSQALLDGTNITSLEQNGGVEDVKYTPSVDVVDEFKIQTNYFSAEFGNTGGAILNIVSKSGANQVHGVGYEFLRDSPLNANSWTSNAAGKTLPASHNNTFGGTFGGPVVIPRVYNGKNRTFIFADFELQRAVSATSRTSTVPTAQELTGDFSQDLRTNGKPYLIYNPYDVTVDPTCATDPDDCNDPSRAPFAGNKVPQSMINPISAKMASFYPAPTSAGNAFTHVNNWFGQGTNHSASNQMDFKIDQNFSERQRLNGRYSLNFGNSTPANLYGNQAYSATNGYDRVQNFVLNYTWVMSPTTVFDVKGAVLRTHATNIPVSEGLNEAALGLPSILEDTVGADFFPQFSVSGYTGLGQGSYSLILQYETNYSTYASVSKIAGAHTIKAGIEAHKIFENYENPNLTQGGFSFARMQTGADPYVSSSSQGDALASLLLGWGSGGTLSYDYPTATSSGYFGTYIQDDWRVTKKLTLNLGLRYDFDIPRTERFNRLDYFNPYAVSPIQGQVSASSDCPACGNLIGQIYPVTKNNRSPFNGDYNNWQPRIGLAYGLNKKTAIRMAYGLFYGVNRDQVKGEVGHLWRNDDSVLFSQDSDITPYATLQNPFPAGLTPPPGPNNPAPYIGFGFSSPTRNSQNQQYQQWNVSLQRALPGQGVLEVNYSASVGHHLYFGDAGDVLGSYNWLPQKYYSLGLDALNTLVPNPFYGVVKDPTSLLSLPMVARGTLLYPYPQYDGEQIGGYLAPPNIANSNYQSLQVKYEKRFSQGLSVVAHYTWSKLISDSDTDASDVSFLAGNEGIQDQFNLHLEKSVSSLDVPQRAVVSFDYQLPVGRGRTFGKTMNRVLDGVIGQWEVSSIITFQTNTPLIPTLDNNNLPDALTQRPNLLGNPCTGGDIESKLKSYFNVDMFSAPDTLGYGTAPRTLSVCRGQFGKNADVAFLKNFGFGESRKLQLRLEAYNATNRVNFGNPNVSYGSSSFGVISSTSNARSLQVAAKFYF